MRLLTLLTVLSLLAFLATAEIALDACKPPAQQLLTRTRAAIYHAYTAYKANALPKDELRPLSCTGVNTFGDLSVTLVDTLDIFIILRDWPEFIWAGKYLRSNLSFDKNTSVSVFETTIRVVGGLLSAHGFLAEGFDDTGFDAWLWWPNYDDSLLYLAYQLVESLLPAFDTPTGIPFGAVNLRYGVANGESIVASTAGAGSLLLEFGTLSRYTGDDIYYNVAFASMKALHSRAADTGLVGNHINVMTGEWVLTESGVGGLIDSFYEYMLKGYILFGDTRLLEMFQMSYKAVMGFIKKGVWYLDADMWSGETSSLVQSSLSAFFPSLQVLMGLADEATETTRAHYAVWRKYGALPDGYYVHMRVPTLGRTNYPLRPELVESVFYLHWITGDAVWIRVAEGVLKGLETVAKVDCGFADVKNVENHQVEDLMDTFVISETLKYVYLVFQSNDHWTRSGKYVFSTEAHPLRIHRSKPNPGDKLKCPRGKTATKLLPCGYGLQGTDVPSFDTSTLHPEVVATEVAEQVEKIIKRYGIQGLHVGRLFVGRDNCYRVVKIVGEEIMFAKLPKEKTRECGRNFGREVVKSVCIWRRP